jgi:hypothetical protein
VRPEAAEGCPEKVDPAFFRYVWSYRERRRPKLLRYLEELRPDQAQVCFTERKQADRYLADISRPAATAGAH